MPRRTRPPKRPLQPDPRYQNRAVQRFINAIMRDGKKSLAQRIVYGALEIMEERSSATGVETFEAALQNVTPQLEVKPRRVGGATYQVPMEIRGDRRNSLAIRWLIRASRNRPGKTMVERLANELMDAANFRGEAVKRKDDNHRMAEANKAFAHYRW